MLMQKVWIIPYLLVPANPALAQSVHKFAGWHKYPGLQALADVMNKFLSNSSEDVKM